MFEKQIVIPFADKQFVSINSENGIKLNQAWQKITWKENFKVTIVFLKCKIFTFGRNQPFGSMKYNCHELEHQKKSSW